MSELQHVIGGGREGNARLSLFQLAEFRLGRVLLWFAAAFVALSSFNGRRIDTTVLFAAFVLAFVALIGHFLAARRKRVARASMRNTLAFFGLMLVVALGALWLVFRRRKKPVDEPPTQSEVDALIQEAGG